MKPRYKSPRQPGGLTAIDGALALVSVLLIVQMWLLTATVEAYLAGHYESVLPGAIISGILFAACVAFYFFVARVDAENRHPVDRSGTNPPQPSKEIKSD